MIPGRTPDYDIPSWGESFPLPGFLPLKSGRLRSPASPSRTLLQALLAMPRDAYVNGRFVPHRQAQVPIEDRGFQFSDGVYEVISVVNGQMVDEAGHLDRLTYSLAELKIAWPMSRRALEQVIRHLIRRNGLKNGIVYLQITRGNAPRDFGFPKAGTRPTLVLTTRRMPRFASPQQLENGVAVVTVPDIRWQRRDIKSIGLLAQVLGKQYARDNGAFEAWLVENGMVNEGCSSNAWIVTTAGVLITQPPSHHILNGITRQAVLRLARSLHYPLEERTFSLAEAQAAQEAFLTSASTFVMPITRIDGQAVGDGRPGPLARALRLAYLDYAQELAPAGGASR